MILMQPMDSCLIRSVSDCSARVRRDAGSSQSFSETLLRSLTISVRAARVPRTLGRLGRRHTTSKPSQPALSRLVSIEGFEVKTEHTHTLEIAEKVMKYIPM